MKDLSSLRCYKSRVWRGLPDYKFAFLYGFILCASSSFGKGGQIGNESTFMFEFMCFEVT